MALRWIILLAMAFGLAVAPVRAERLPGLYQETLPVGSQSAAARNRAAADALATVLVRLSGSRTVLEDSAVRAALQRADEYLDQYQYSRRENPETGEQQWYVTLHFEQRQLERMLRRAGLPIWPATRPTVLVWLVIDNAEGRHLANAETDPDFVAALQEHARRRGVALKFPLLDLQDTAVLSPDDVWAMNHWPIRRASDRYEAASILVGRVSRLSGGQLLGQWQYLLADQAIDIDGQADAAPAYVAPAIDTVAEALARRYAIAPVKLAAQGILMRVRGVRDFTDYARAVSYLESIAAIDHANAVQINGDELILRLLAQGRLEQLERVFALDGRLEPAPATQDAPVPVNLDYRWVPDNA